mmetsp:Transcript_58987/g.149729  ORF Transcript_58987/g.149729 Transcript_58987/m.149729 type:complete len:339 (+) Transcript_58987:70-1086(+)
MELSAFSAVATEPRVISWEPTVWQVGCPGGRQVLPSAGAARGPGGHGTTCCLVASVLAGLVACRLRGGGARRWKSSNIVRNAAVASEGAQLSDGRKYHVFLNDAAVAEHVCASVRKLMVSAIAEKGAFAMSIGSGTTVAPLQSLGVAKDIDFRRVHVFFGNDRTSGDSAGKCFAGAREFVQACGIPALNVHAIGAGDPEEMAAKYEKHILGMPLEVVGRCQRNGYAALDLFLLGSGADGHTASLYPGSSQVLNPGGRLVLSAEGKGGVTASIDYISSARQVIISAGKASQANMVAIALGRADAASNTQCPVGMISVAEGTGVDWLLTESSAAELLKVV